MKLIFILIGVCYFENCLSAPTRTAKDILLISSRYTLPPYNTMPYPQVRGPFDFIGNWIQSSEWFPIEINVPDTVSGVSNGIGTFATNVGSGFNNIAQNVGTGLQTFTQNLGTGFQTFTQNVGNNVQNVAQNLSQRFPIFAVFVRPNTPPRYFVLVPTHNNPSMNQNSDKKKELPLPMPEIESDVLESFP